MRETGASPPFLLGCFADFYEEVASIKLAIGQGQLSTYLVIGDEAPPTRSSDFASRVSTRLEAMLRQQAANVRRHGTVAEMNMLGLAQYVMTAVADEIFILELDWPGRDAWLDVLLEYRIFRSQNSGTKFFELADQLLNTHNRSVLHVDAASVFLLALQLGFKGLYRGTESAGTLRSYRQQLYQFSGARGRQDANQPAFVQAYAHRLAGTKDERLAPLSRWKIVWKIALVAYLAASTIVWMVAMYPFERAFGT